MNLAKITIGDFSTRLIKYLIGVPSNCGMRSPLNVHVLILFSLCYSKLKLHRKKSVTSLEVPLQGVSVLKPLTGVDSNLYSNLESFFTMNYPTVSTRKNYFSCWKVKTPVFSVQCFNELSIGEGSNEIPRTSTTILASEFRPPLLRGVSVNLHPKHSRRSRTIRLTFGES